MLLTSYIAWTTSVHLIGQFPLYSPLLVLLALFIGLLTVTVEQRFMHIHWLSLELSNICLLI